MDSLPLGLSIHHFVSSVGAEVGFASLIVAMFVIYALSSTSDWQGSRSRSS